MCQFAHLKPGDSVTLNVTNGYCGKCGIDFAYKTQAIYRGHTTAYRNGLRCDDFELTPSLTCSGCGAFIDHYIELCKDDDAFADIVADIEQPELVPVFQPPDPIDWIQHMQPAVPEIDPDLFKRYN